MRTRARAALDQRALRAAGLARRLARHSPRAFVAGRRERLRGLIGRHARLGPILIERLRRAADAAARAFAREAALQARRRLERAEAVRGLSARLARAFAERQQNRRARLASAAQMLGAVSYRAVLERGFALVRDEGSRPLRRAAEVRAAEPLTIEFADGPVAAVAKGGAPPAASSRAAPDPLSGRLRRARSRSDVEGQGTLF